MVAINNNVSIIDGTVLGMGRGAGNLKLELILAYLNSKDIINVDLNILGRYVELFSPLLDLHGWGINLAYIVSGCYSLPQKDVMDALEINRYSLSGIVSKLRSNLKLQLPEYAPNGETRSCLIVGGGSTIRKHIRALRTYLSKNRDIVLLHSTSRYLGLFSDLENKQYFAMTGDELLKLEPLSGIQKYILGPDLNTTDNIRHQPESLYQLKEITFTNKHPDSPLSTGLQIALEMSCESIYLAGFDGYEELKNKKDLYLMNENQDILNIFTSKYSVVSLTPTKYKHIKQQSIYSKI
jgi:4-hydroxy 2-oxovalerate aldolase